MRSVLPGTSRREAEEFAALLERDRLPAGVAPGSELAALVGLTRALTPATITPLPGFRAALRDRLVAEAANRPVAVPAPRQPAEPPRTARHAVRHAVATLAALTLVTGAGAAAASSRALPGDLLYDVKRQVESLELALAFGDLAEGRELLEQADARLGEAERVAAASTSDEAQARATIESLLAEWDAATAAGAAQLTDAYRETGSEEPMRLLDRFVTDSEERLRDLLAILDPSLRARVRAALDALAALGVQAQAVLPAGSSAALGDNGGGGAAVADRGDGWAVSRLVDRVGSDAPTLALTGDGSATGATATQPGDSTGGTASTQTAVGDAVDTATATGGGSTDGSGSTGSLDGGLLTGGSTTTTSTDPLAPLPLPVVTTVPTPEASLTVTDPLPSTSTSTSTSTTLPVGDVTCVPLPPLTTC